MYVKHRFKITEVHTSTWVNVFIVMAISAIVVHLYWDLDFKFLAIPLGIPGLIGTTISLILAFRTNASYARWWEARKVWGAIVNDSRSLVRQTIANFGNSETAKTEIKQLAHRQIAWNYALANSLRKKEVMPKIEKYLNRNEINTIKAHDNIPNALLLLHERQLKKQHDNGVLDTFQYLQLSSLAQNLTDSMGKCERIKNTIFPTQYSFYIHMTIMTFVITLPLGIMKEIGFFAVLISGIVAFLFLTIEHMAIDLQNPFENAPNDTPMNALSRTIEVNILEMLEEENVPEKLKPIEGVLM
jgi:putative membrane protein